MGNYLLEKEKKQHAKLMEIVSKLPDFCSDYFVGIEQNTTILTRINYALDLNIFFNYLIKYYKDFGSEIASIADIKTDDLEKITPNCIERFLSYLTIYEINGISYQNSPKAKSRKLSSIRSLLKFFFIRGNISKNIGEKVRTPKLHSKEIVYLNNEEVSNILEEAEYGENLTKTQKKFHGVNKIRDTAILTLFLGTGIRVSELVGISNNDINFNENSFIVTRKGGNRAILYFSEEVATALKEYLKQKIELCAKFDTYDKEAFFLSLQGSRVSVRNVQILVKKYAKIISPLKKITPHKLRSTYGTQLYAQTKDIYIVADVLGHKDVNTTTKHYAAISENIRKDAAEMVVLRKKDPNN